MHLITLSIFLGSISIYYLLYGSHFLGSRYPMTVGGLRGKERVESIFHIFEKKFINVSEGLALRRGKYFLK